MTEADEPDHSKDDGGLDVRGRAQSQLARLPEEIATAVAEFITGQLLDNPLRVGHPLRDEYEGQYSARRGSDGRIRYRVGNYARS